MLTLSGKKKKRHGTTFSICDQIVTAIFRQSYSRSDKEANPLSPMEKDLDLEHYFPSDIPPPKKSILMRSIPAVLSYLYAVTCLYKLY